MWELLSESAALPGFSPATALGQEHLGGALHVESQLCLSVGLDRAEDRVIPAPRLETELADQIPAGCAIATGEPKLLGCAIESRIQGIESRTGRRIPGSCAEGRRQHT